RGAAGGAAAGAGAGDGGGEDEGGLFGWCEEVARVLLVQMAREGVHHLAQMEQVLQARAQLLAARPPPHPHPHPHPHPSQVDPPAGTPGGTPATAAPLQPSTLTHPDVPTSTSASATFTAVAPPALGLLSQRVADVLAAWRGLPPAARLWGALAHNLAHWEAVRRPLALTAGVLGAPAAAAAAEEQAGAAVGKGSAGGGGSRTADVVA
ncbi:hypothetical protein Agub_g525, partial [Astrephomene gubernaculifera]